VEFGIRSCSELLCLENYKMARRGNYMTREQLIARIGIENFEFHFKNGEISHMGPVDQAETWQFGVCVREDNDHRVTLFMTQEDGIAYQRVTFYLSDLLEWNAV